MRSSYVVCILAILQTCLLAECGLPFVFSPHIRRNCSTIVSARVSRRVPYIETYKEKTWGLFYKTKTRWNYRTEYHVSWHKEYKCCDGYEERRFDICTPICQPACGEGICVKPNICFCHWGYSFINSKNTDTLFDHACEPVCSHACVNGRCTAPDVCTCNHGYSMSNDSFACEPVCNPECGARSYCDEPDHCVCAPGYAGVISSTNERVLHRCDPVCDNVCVNGKCTAPNNCTCNDGYKLDPDDLFVCKPVCEHDCSFGTCTAPDVCTCDKGYTSIPDSPDCKPVCSEDCVKGLCTSPETCTCLAGYGLSEGSKYVCEPVCEKACINGTCTAPDVCTCHEGYRLSGDESTKHICEPDCKDACGLFAVCIGPKSCACVEGYQPLTRQINKYLVFGDFNINAHCEPVCEQTCINGFCSAPNTCSCHQGYHPTGGNTSVCEPTCTHDCVNGFCSEPDTCKCHEGYRFSNNTFCEPICIDKCVNGYCNAPYVCICNPGYRLSKDYHKDLCEPVCQPACKNGICVQPNICNCNEGYRQSRHSASVCEPVCHAACERNGICEAPDVCVCENGYRMVHHDEGSVPFECEPICSFDCGNGTCTAPDRCACFDGYRNTETGGCEPECAICHNGTCVAPDVCECNDGYVPEESSHIGGWKRVESTAGDATRTNGSGCVPRCESCEHGECVAPDECLCHAGFVNIGGTCVDACEDGCDVHGKCVDERRMCECDYGWTGPRCDRPTLCVLILHDEENRIESLQIVEEQNATIERVLTDNPACLGCKNKLNNETLCFKMYINDTKNQIQISCLMDYRECLTSSEYVRQKEIIKVGGIASVFGILFLISIGMAIYILRRKHRSKQIDLAINNEYNTSMQGLVEDD